MKNINLAMASIGYGFSWGAMNISGWLILSSFDKDPSASGAYFAIAALTSPFVISGGTVLGYFIFRK